MTSFALNNGYTRIYYLDGQNWIHELGWTGSGWSGRTCRPTRAAPRRPPAVR